MARYRYYVNGNQVICVSSYAKKPVKGVAKCSPEDTFNLEIGKQLAKLRCDAKVTKLRMRRAKEDKDIASRWLNNSLEYFTKCDNYYRNSYDENYKANKELNAFIKNLKNN